MGPKIGVGKPGNNGLCGHKASMHPGSSALLHPLLCGGSTTSNLLFSLDQRHSPARDVRSAAQVPSRARRVRLLLLRRPQAELGGRSDQPEGAVALVRANQGAGAVVGHRCGHTWRRQGERAHNFGSPTSTPFQAPFSCLSFFSFYINNSLLYLR